MRDDLDALSPLAESHRTVPTTPEDEVRRHVRLCTRLHAELAHRCRIRSWFQQLEYDKSGLTEKPRVVLESPVEIVEADIRDPRVGQHYPECGARVEVRGYRASLNVEGAESHVSEAGMRD